AGVISEIGGRAPHLFSRRQQVPKKLANPNDNWIHACIKHQPIGARQRDGAREYAPQTGGAVRPRRPFFFCGGRMKSTVEGKIWAEQQLRPTRIARKLIAPVPNKVLAHRGGFLFIER